MAGLDPTTYATFFSPDGRTQMKCAAGDKCGQKNASVILDPSLHGV
jgi:hypothetical protein